MLAALLVLCGLAATCSPAVADSSQLPAPVGFTVQGSNGYSIFVFGVVAHRGTPATVGIDASRGKSAAFYTVPGTVTETSIQAELGALGRIAVAFHPSGRPRTARSACSDKPVHFDSGFYEGTIDFHGEEGYTAVEATRAPGDLGFLLDLVCSGISGGSGGPFLPGAELEVEARGPRPPHLNRLGPSLKVVKNRPRAPAHFEVSLSEEHEGIGILRLINPIAPANAFEYDPRVRTATVHPPPPFAGTARFHRNAKPANQWTGDLIADLPGKSGVRLTGTDLRARLVHAKWDWTPSLAE